MKREVAQKMLNELYNDYFVKRYQEICMNVDLDIIEKLSTPYLVNIPEAYFSGKRIWYVGQEPFKWYGYYKKTFIEKRDRPFFPELDAVDYAVSVHKKFFDEGMINSPIWNFFKKLDENASKKILCNNIYKFSYVEAGLSPNSKLFKNKQQREQYLKPLYELQRDLLLKELEILKPDVVLFMTGNPNDPLFFDNIDEDDIRYDSKVYKVKYEDIPEMAAKGVDKWKFGRLVYEKFPRETYRTYHPGYLQRNPDLHNLVMPFLKKNVQQ